MKRRMLEQTEHAELKVESNRQFVIEALLQEVEGYLILEIDIWGKKDAFGRRGLMCRHFLNKYTNEYDTLFMTDQYFQRRTYHVGEWSRMKMISVLSRGDYYYSYWNDRDAAVSKEAIQIINSYFPERSYETGIRHVESVEGEISAEKSNVAYHRKVDRINDAMSRVEPIGGENFDSWIRTVVFPERYIFAETRKLKRGFRCRCTECGKTFMSREKPRHNEKLKCKKCGTDATVKTRVQQITEEKKVLVAQQYDDKAWILRHFKFKKYSGRTMGETKSSISEIEKARMILQKGKTIKIYWGQNNKYGADEFMQEWWDKKGGSGMNIDHKFFLYPEGLNEIDMPIELKRMLKAGAEARKEMDYNQLVRSFEKHPYMEYLIKGRYYKLADYIIENYGWWGRPEGLLDITSDEIFDLLQIEPQRAYRLRDMNGGRYALELLRTEECDGIKISQENLRFADEKNIDVDDLEIERTRMNPNKLLNYVRRQMEKNKMSYSSFKQYYKDYLDMAEERGADLTDDIIRANPRMIEFHMAYLEEKNRIKDKEEEGRLRKKFPNIRKDYKKNMDLMAWTNEEYIISVPRDVKDIQEEGRTQHHCVAASERYFDKMNRRESFILFLRRKENPKIPYYTLEVELKEEKVRVIQKHAAYDRQPDIQNVNKVLDKWRKDIVQRMKMDNKKELQAAV